MPICIYVIFMKGAGKTRCLLLAPSWCHCDFHAEHRCVYKNYPHKSKYYFLLQSKESFNVLSLKVKLFKMKR